MRSPKRDWWTYGLAVGSSLLLFVLANWLSSPAVQASAKGPGFAQTGDATYK